MDHKFFWNIVNTNWQIATITGYNVATLVWGKVPVSQLPAITINDKLWSFTSLALALADTTVNAWQIWDYFYVTAWADKGTYFVINNSPTLAWDVSKLVTPDWLVQSVNSQTWVVVLTKTDLSLWNVDNTSDANKPVSTAQQTALDLKEDEANKWVANWYASLDASVLVPKAQIPALIYKSANKVVVAWYLDAGTLYEEVWLVTPITPATWILYVDLVLWWSYTWSWSAYVSTNPEIELVHWAWVTFWNYIIQTYIDWVLSPNLPLKASTVSATNNITAYVDAWYLPAGTYYCVVLK